VASAWYLLRQYQQITTSLLFAALLTDAPTRDTLRRTFLSQAGLADVGLQPLCPDASFRRYFRLATSDGQWLLMDAPPDYENVDAFVRIAKHLATLGLRSPQIGKVDNANGFALIEDFGNDTFTALLDAGENEQTLYCYAIDVLTTLHQQARATDLALPAYDLSAFMDEALLMVDWYAPLVTGAKVIQTDRQRYQQIWKAIFEALPPPVTTLVLRDFHADNLMWIPGESPEGQIGLLDFQDARIGPIAYDVVSLLEDARRDLNPELVNTMRRRYLKVMSLEDTENFNAWYRVLGAQRHCKVAGIFSRLALRDDKPAYLRHLPRVINLLQQHLGDPLLMPLSQWLDEIIPQRHALEPIGEIQDLREKLGITPPRTT